MTISMFDLFSIGIGPSSSHTVGPMIAANQFAQTLIERNHTNALSRIQIELYGSLAYTGVGHGTHPAILCGLQGALPDTIDPDDFLPCYARILDKQQLQVTDSCVIPFSYKEDFLCLSNQTLPNHSNGMRLLAYSKSKEVLFEEIYYSIGGGFVVTEAQFGQDDNPIEQPYPFSTGAQLLDYANEHQLSIAQIMLANECVWQDEASVRAKILEIAQVMGLCIQRGSNADGVLPGGLNVRRRAPIICKQLSKKPFPASYETTDSMDWLNMYAIAVNEENASYGRVVTAPTNGAAGIIPAVLEYFKNFYPDVTDDHIVEYLLTAGAIALLYKKQASISGAEVGCQGEVGVAASMAAGALCSVIGGNPEQVENAAEIAMEHSLGMTCDPVNGLVQIPCIERNAMGAVKAVNAARLALLGDGTHIVSLDKVIKTMRDTGRDMQTIYKETSQGGLAVNVVEC